MSYPPEQSHRTINWASDFTFEDNWPPTDDEPQCKRETDATTEIIHELEDMDTTVFTPWADGENEEFIAQIGGKLFRVRVSLVWESEGRLRCAIDPYVEMDVHILYWEDGENAYAVPDSQVARSVSLRVSEPQKEHPETKYAADYLLERNWPPVANP